MLAPETGFLSRRIAQEAATLGRIGADVDVYPALDGLSGVGAIGPGARLLPKAAALPASDTLARRAKGIVRRRARPVHRLIDALQYSLIDRAKQIADANEAELQRLGPYDLIVAHDLPVLPLALRLKRAWRVPVVVDLHEIFPEQTDVLGSPQAAAYWRRVESACLPEVDGIVSVNEAIDDYVVKWYRVTPNRAVVHNAVPYRDNVGPPSRPSIHEIYELPEAVRIAVFAGSLRLNGNLSMLIEGFGEAQLDGWVLAFIGDGPARQDLERLVIARGLGDRVRIGYQAPQQDLVSIISTGDFGVIPFRPVSMNLEISTPAKLYEYIQARLPVLTTELPLVARIVNEHHNGAFLDASTSATTADGFRQFVSESLPAIGPDILERTARSVSWQAEEAQLLAVLDAASPGTYDLGARLNTEAMPA